MQSVPGAWLIACGGAGDGRQGKWEATGHIVKLQDSSEEVTMELRDSQKLPIDTTTGKDDCQTAYVRQDRASKW